MNSRVGNFNFYGSYQAADIVKKILGDDEEDALHIVEYYIDDLDSSEMIALAKFSKHTLLHGFILHCLGMWFSEETKSFKKNGTILLGSYYELDTMLKKYQIEHTELDITEEPEVDSIGETNSDILLDWIEENYESFNQLWQKIADEVFHILFRDMLVLQCFNRIIALCVKNWEKDFLAEYRTGKGFFRRCCIPKWLEEAVFHRDQGRCVFCNKDLTGIINTLTSKNFDHIVPLSLYGVNDPTNIQLTCGECNRRKSNKNKNTSISYAKWW